MLCSHLTTKVIESKSTDEITEDWGITASNTPFLKGKLIDSILVSIRGVNMKNTSFDVLN